MTTRACCSAEFQLHLLRSFVALADEGHFGRAAASLHITPSALTQQIQRLEREVGFVLLDRDHTARPAVVTPAGEAFLREARRLIAAVDRAAAMAQALARSINNQFILGFSGTPLGRYTTQLISAFDQRAGSGCLKLVELPLSDQTEAVRRGRVDASLAHFRLDDESGLAVTRVVRAPRVLAVSAGHRLAARASVRFADAQGETHVHLDRELASMAYLQWSLTGPSGATVYRTTTASTMPELLESVASGRAVAIVSQLLADDHTRADISYVPIADLAPSDVVLCTRRGDTSLRVTLMRRVVTELPSTLARRAIVSRADRPVAVGMGSP